MKIEIISATNVLVDGQPAGTVVDVLANNAGREDMRPALLDAWLAYEARITSDLLTSQKQRDEALAALAAETEPETQAVTEAATTTEA